MEVEEKVEQVEEMKVWHKLVQEKFAKMSIDEKEVTQPMRNRLKAVQSGIDICNEVYAEGNVSWDQFQSKNSWRTYRGPASASEG